MVIAAVHINDVGTFALFGKNCRHSELERRRYARGHVRFDRFTVAAELRVPELTALRKITQQELRCVAQASHDLLVIQFLELWLALDTAGIQDVFRMHKVHYNEKFQSSWNFSCGSDFTLRYALLAFVFGRRKRNIAKLASSTVITPAPAQRYMF